MAEVTYTCPKCATTLKPAKAVAPGKKIKCPKCETVFAAPEQVEQVAIQPASSAKASAPARPPGDDDDDDGAGTYGVIKEPEQEVDDDEDDLDDDDDDDVGSKKRKKKKKKKSALDPLEDVDREARSKRGPAGAIVMGPANALLKTSLLAICCWVANFCIAIFPILFPLKSNDGSVPQVDTVSVGGTIEADDHFIFSIGNDKLPVVAESTDPNEVRDNLVKAINSRRSGEFEPLMAKRTSKTGEFTITAEVSGEPFSLEVSTTEGNNGKADGQKISRETTVQNVFPEGQSGPKKKDKKADQMDQELKEALATIWAVYTFMALFGCILGLPYGIAVCVGAVKMQQLESYVLSMIASIMSLIPIHMLGASLFVLVVGFFAALFIPCLGCIVLMFAMFLTVPLPIWGLISGIRCLMALRHPDVIEGFYEKPKY